MKTLTTIPVAIILSGITLFIIANKIENGDTNAISMYFVVFLVPCIVLATINGIYLFLIDKLKNIYLTVTLSLLPILFMVILSLAKNLNVSFIDGSLQLVGLIMAISIGLTNLFWIYKKIKAR